MEHPDHRRIGRELGIFANDELCGSGLPLWLPAGAAVRAEIERFVVELERKNGYQHVYTPELAKRELYVRSGHWEHFHDDMYPPMRTGTEQVVLRPMNCPHHILVFAAQRRSVRDLPIRIAELGTMFRYERSGVVGGLSRVRQMTLNDGHVFCLPEHLEAEIGNILAMVEIAYEALGIPAPHYRLSLRGPGPKYVADDGLWQRSEAVLRAALRNLGADYEEAPDEAAFYGPKIDLQVSDPQGREETLSTVQVDFHLARPVRPRRVRRRHPSPTGDDPPEHRLDDGADGRTPARGPRRRAPGLVGSVPGADRSDRRRRRRALAPGSRSAPGLWRARRGRRSRRDARRQDPRRAARQGPLRRRDRATGSRERERRRPVTRRSSARSAYQSTTSSRSSRPLPTAGARSSWVRISPSPIASTRARRRGDSCLSPCTCTSDPCSARLRRAGSTCPPSCGRARPTCTLPCTW